MRRSTAAVLGTRWFGYRAEVAIQLAAVVIVVVSIAIALVVDTAPLRTVAFAIAISLMIVATVLAAILGRTGSDWLLAVPVLDMIALIVMQQVPEHHVHALSILAILPALWLGLSGRPVFAGLAVLLSLGLVEVAGVGELDSMDLEHALRNFLTPAVVSIAAASTFVASRRAAASIRSLIEQERETAASLAREKRTSELLDAMLDAVDIGILAYDAEGNQILANRSVLSHPVIVNTGLTPLELDQQGYMLQEDRVTSLPDGQGFVTRALRGDEYSNQIIWISAPGTRQHAVAASARPLHDTDGRFAGTVIAIDDVTAYLETIAAKDEFVGSVSHEFRTPLASILGYLELVLEEPERLPDDVRQHLGVVERNADRLQRLVLDLLEAASRKREAVRLQRQSTDVVALCAAVLERCRTAAEKAGVQFALDASGPVIAVIDPKRISQAIDSLVSNAMKFSPFGGQVRLTVSSDGENVTITVTDNGIGVPSEELEAMTSPFYRAGTIGEHFPGVGLALTVTKAIVEEHRGSLSFESTEGRGTTVTVRLAVR